MYRDLARNLDHRKEWVQQDRVISVLLREEVVVKLMVQYPKI